MIATMVLCEHVRHHHQGVMNEEIIAIETEKDTVLLTTKALSEVVVAVVAEAGGDVVGHPTTVDRPAERSS